ncbi:MAG: trypsin-like peptidase domain-containing protein [Spirochaetia bacterium]
MRGEGLGQKVFFFVAGMVVVVSLMIGFGVLSIPDNSETEGEEGKTAGGRTPEGTSEKTPEEMERIGSEPFRLKTDSSDTESIQAVNLGDEQYSSTDLRNIQVYEKRNRGVVNITTETLSLNWFLEPVPKEGDTGSGSIIDERGYILTNDHVVREAYKVYITLHDGSQYEGEVVGKDRENDLAVVKFDPGDKPLTTIPFGTSENLKVGQSVLAIGNPFGYDRTLTTGIVSGLGRPVKASRNRVIRGMIQTDASINPGNSGGPLLNSEGEMIGINTMIYSPSGGSVGIGFAIPVHTAKRVVPELIEYGRVRRGWIEIFPVQLEPSIVRYGDLSVSRGILVSEVRRGGNADEAGIQGGDKNNPIRYGRSVIYLGGDIIVRVDETKTATISDLFAALEDNKPGETVEVGVVRDGRRKTFDVELVKRPEDLVWE